MKPAPNPEAAVKGTAPASGAQVIERSCLLMREIARFGSAGARLVDLTKASQLTHGTVHRILQSLISEGFLLQEADTKRYKLGAGIFELGLAAPSPLDHFAELRLILDEFANKIGDTAYLMMRRGDEIICLARAEGNSPVRAYIIEVGGIRPLAASLSGISMMSAASDDEIEMIINRTAQVSDRFGNATPSYMRRQVSHSRKHGYCISREVLMKTVTGVSAPVKNAKGLPFLGISISAISSRLPDRRVKGLVDELFQTCSKMEAVLKGG